MYKKYYGVKYLQDQQNKKIRFVCLKRPTYYFRRYDEFCIFQEFLFNKGIWQIFQETLLKEFSFRNRTM